MSRILAPHKEQDGWVYWRVKIVPTKAVKDAPLENAMVLVNKSTMKVMHPDRINAAIGYTDDTKGSRIISSRRVEQDVETGDYLRLCDDEGAWVVRKAGEWAVSGKGGYASGTTLREAYHRYKNANA